MLRQRKHTLRQKQANPINKVDWNVVKTRKCLYVDDDGSDNSWAIGEKREKKRELLAALRGKLDNTSAHKTETQTHQKDRVIEEEEAADGTE